MIFTVLLHTKDGLGTEIVLWKKVRLHYVPSPGDRIHVGMLMLNVAAVHHYAVEPTSGPPPMSDIISDEREAPFPHSIGELESEGFEKCQR